MEPVLQYGIGGVPTITLSIPQRYLHSPIGVASLVDIQATLDLITEFVKVFDNNKNAEPSHQLKTCFIVAWEKASSLAFFAIREV